MAFDSTNDPTRRRLSRRSIPTAVVLALLAAVVGAVLWTLATAYAGHKNVFLALVIGLLVGGAVRLAGFGNAAVLQPRMAAVLAGLSALLGCLLGAVLIIIWFVAFDNDISYLTAAQRNSPVWVLSVLKESFVLLDGLMFGAAALLAGQLATSGCKEAA